MLFSISLLLVNVVNFMPVNLAFLTAYLVKYGRLRVSWWILLACLFSFVQFALIGDIERSLKTVWIFLFFSCAIKIPIRKEFSNPRVFLFIHAAFGLLMLIDGVEQGRVRNGGYVGLFDEGSVAAFFFGTLLLVRKNDRLTNFFLLIAIYASEALTGTIYLISFCLLNALRARAVAIVSSLIMLLVAPFFLDALTDHRIVKELYPALVSLISNDPNFLEGRPSSSGSRITQEVMYGLQLFHSDPWMLFFGDVYFPERTASLNILTELLLTCGLGGSLLLAVFLIKFVKVHRFPVQHKIALGLLVFSTGAVFKPLVMYLLLLCFSSGWNDIRKYNHA